MGKKYYGSSKSYAKLPKDVKMKSYPSLRTAMRESEGYVDTQPQLDSEFSKAVSKLRRGK